MRHQMTIIDESKITDNLTLKFMMSNNEETIHLRVDYMNGRFIVEKSFKNNYLGLERMKEQILKLDTEEKIIKYLRLEDINEWFVKRYY